MKKIELFFILLLLTLTQGRLAAQSPEADSIDVLHYVITLDMGNTVNKQLQGYAEITFLLTRDCNQVTFDLIADQVSPITLDGTVTRGFNYDRDNALLTVYAGGHAGDTHVVSVPYVTNGYVESYGWGGLHFDNALFYNLGVAFLAHPHVFGRAWFPCRDNFYDKATYTLIVTSKPGWRAICGGIRQSETINPDSSNTSVWALSHPTPTYLVSVSSAPWQIIEREYTSLYGTYPAIIGYLNRDSTQVYNKFGILDDVLPAFEQAFGPYRWGRVGYIATPKGSMEHANNIALVDACIAVADNLCQMTTCHELGHAWFGNLLTCLSEGDMWINEGGATFCEEVATEAVYDRPTATQYYIDMLREVLLTAHVNDNGYHPLSPMESNHIYGTTTYKKGALVWHSLRGIMGDSLFYACMNRLFDRCAFRNIDAVALRDSLSLYSGLDLEGFFDFHVFHPGFVDYAVQHLQSSPDGTVTLTLRQQLRGTTHYAHGQRVPITFFSHDSRQRADRWLTVDDSLSTHTLALPFVAAYAVVDLHNLISDAATNSAATITHSGTYDLGNTYCKLVIPSDADLTDSHRVYITHHFSHPAGPIDPGILRISNRYWEVHTAPYQPAVSLRLLYNLGANGSSGASCLDRGFYDNRATLDSLCVVYRPDDQHPWQLVSRRRTAASTIATGYFVTSLLPGHYALAVADTTLAAIPLPADDDGPSLTISPNPVIGGSLQLLLNHYDKNFDLIIYSTDGRKLLSINNITSPYTLHHTLPPGNYIAIIKNNFISLQSQFIVQ